MFSSSGFSDRSAYLALWLLERPHSLQPLQLLQTPVGGEDKPMYFFVHLVVQPEGSLDGVPGKERVRKLFRDMRCWRHPHGESTAALLASLPSDTDGTLRGGPQPEQEQDVLGGTGAGVRACEWAGMAPQDRKRQEAFHRDLCCIPC